jgi:site-specific recombinase XerD
MVVTVKLEGLNIVKARGRWYVYVRETGDALFKGFDGSRDDLMRRLGEPDMLALYNSKRVRDLKNVYPEKSLGWLVEWFQTKCPRWDKLSDATKKDYLAAFAYLRPEFDCPLDSITQASLYETRDVCAKAKWPRFADKMISAVSSMFSHAVKRQMMSMNPAMGIDKIHTADPNSNREWSAEEWADAIRLAPTEIKTPLMLARYAGFRGQTIAVLQWKHYQPHPSFGKCFRIVVRKNAEPTFVPAVAELQSYLADLPRNSVNIATRADGTTWDDEKQMQTSVSHFLRGIKDVSAVGAGATLHGLRVSYAAELRRDGADAGGVAAALGDRSTRMGEHYTRHVENEAKVIRAFGKKKGR